MRGLHHSIAMKWLPVAAALVAGCGTSSTEPNAPSSSDQPAANAADKSSGSTNKAAEAPAAPKPCKGEKLPRFEGGVEKEQACLADLPPAQVVLDLADAWTPALFAIRDGKAPDYRETYLRLATE